MGYGVYGTDLEPRMIEYTKENLNWLTKRLQVTGYGLRLEMGDATSHIWTHKFDSLASEVWLGRPFTAPPPPAILRQNINDVNTILKKFLSNLHSQVPVGFRMCLAVPAWQVANQTHRLPLLERLTDVGYNRIALRHVSFDQLIYARPGQIVGRELVILERN